GPPPRITGRDLAAFVERFTALGVSAGSCELPDWPLHLAMEAAVRFGKRIDCDTKSCYTEKIEHGGMISSFRPINGTLDIKRGNLKSVEELVDALRAHTRSAYRGYVLLGALAPSLVSEFHWDTMIGGERFYLCPNSWSLWLEPQTYGDEDTGEAHFL